MATSPEHFTLQYLLSSQWRKIKAISLCLDDIFQFSHQWPFRVRNCLATEAHKRKTKQKLQMKQTDDSTRGPGPGEFPGKMMVAPLKSINIYCHHRWPELKTIDRLIGFPLIFVMSNVDQSICQTTIAEGVLKRWHVAVIVVVVVVVVSNW